eukprot:Selendium_serpulae@DN6963_c0_g1_i1.p1
MTQQTSPGLPPLWKLVCEDPQVKTCVVATILKPTNPKSASQTKLEGPRKVSRVTFKSPVRTKAPPDVLPDTVGSPWPAYGPHKLAPKNPRSKPILQRSLTSSFCRAPPPVWPNLVRGQDLQDRFAVGKKEPFFQSNRSGVPCTLR